MVGKFIEMNNILNMCYFNWLEISIKYKKNESQMKKLFLSKGVGTVY